jgi:polyhydroxybutyrate depolymerase
MVRFWITVILLVMGVTQACAAPMTRTLVVDGIQRTALLYPGKDATNTASPVVLVFHGFSIPAEDMATKVSKVHEAWPEATVVYPQGLPLPGTSLGSRGVGWQIGSGTSRNRDARFVDALIGDLRAVVRVDERRIYAAGYSNGAQFVYLLLALRPDKFAAFAVVAGGMGIIESLLASTGKARPVLVIHGKDDRTVPLAHGKQAVDLLRRVNRCGGAQHQWAPGFLVYPSYITGQPVVWNAHDGGHGWPQHASAHIARFFAEHPPAGGASGSVGR